jgi:dTDP-glucose 4,6-dehydratase
MVVPIFDTYGPRRRSNDGRATPTFVKQALANEPITVFGDGSQTRSFCYVSDLMEGLCRLAASGGRMPVNTGNPTELSLAELAETVVRLTGSESCIVYAALPIDDPKVCRPGITRAKELLGWEPTVPLAKGLAKVVKFERKNRSHSQTAL